MSGKFDLSQYYIYLYILYIYIYTSQVLHIRPRKNPLRFYSTVNCTSNELKVVAAAGELRKMTCPMSRGREEEEMGQKYPMKCSLTPRLQHKSQVLRESPRRAHIHMSRASQPVFAVQVTNLVQRLVPSNTDSSHCPVPFLQMRKASP